MGFQLLPVTRFSLWTRLLGVPFERALTLHRWAGWWVPAAAARRTPARTCHATQYYQ